MKRDFNGSHIQFVRSLSASARADLLSRPWPAEAEQKFQAQTEESIEAQAAIERMDQMSFEEFRNHYVCDARLELRAR